MISPTLAPSFGVEPNITAVMFWKARQIANPLKSVVRQGLMDQLTHLLLKYKLEGNYKYYPRSYPRFLALQKGLNPIPAGLTQLVENLTKLKSKIFLWANVHLCHIRLKKNSAVNCH